MLAQRTRHRRWDRLCIKSVASDPKSSYFDAMQPDPAAAALANWNAARSEQLEVERQLEHARKHGPRARLAELLAVLDKLEVQSALLLAHAVKVRLACGDGWPDSENVTSTRMGLPDDLRQR